MQDHAQINMYVYIYTTSGFGARLNYSEDVDGVACTVKSDSVDYIARPESECMMLLYVNVMMLLYAVCCMFCW